MGDDLPGPRNVVCTNLATTFNCQITFVHKRWKINHLPTTRNSYTLKSFQPRNKSRPPRNKFSHNVCEIVHRNPIGGYPCCAGFFWLLFLHFFLFFFWCCSKFVWFGFFIFSRFPTNEAQQEGRSICFYPRVFEQRICMTHPNLQQFAWNNYWQRSAGLVVIKMPPFLLKQSLPNPQATKSCKGPKTRCTVVLDLPNGLLPQWWPNAIKMLALDMLLVHIVFNSILFCSHWFLLLPPPKKKNGFWQTRKAHEYLDDPDVLEAKLDLFVSLIKQSRQMVLYTGAGISTASGEQSFFFFFFFCTLNWIEEEKMWFEALMIIDWFTQESGTTQVQQIRLEQQNESYLPLMLSQLLHTLLSLLCTVRDTSSESFLPSFPLFHSTRLPCFLFSLSIFWFFLKSNFVLNNDTKIRHWVQQNHDGLPQKAGFPQECLNEVRTISNLLFFFLFECLKKKLCSDSRSVVWSLQSGS